MKGNEGKGFVRLMCWMVMWWISTANKRFSTEILMQARSSSVIEGSVYGLPGDTIMCFDCLLGREGGNGIQVKYLSFLS